MRASPLRSKTVVSANNAGKRQTMAATLSTTPAAGCQAAGKNPTSHCSSRTNIWSSLSVMG